MRKRFGILMLLTLAIWPFLGFLPCLESVVVNGLLLDVYPQLGLLTVINVNAFFFCFSILRLQNTRIKGTVLTNLIGDGNAPWGFTRVFATTLLGTIAPIVLAYFFGSDFPVAGYCHLCWSLLTIILASIIAVIGLFGIGWLKCLLVGSEKETSNYFPFEARTWKVEGFVETSDSANSTMAKRLDFHKEDWQFLIYLVLLALSHLLLFYCFEVEDYWYTSAPYMLVLMIWVAFMTLAGFAGILDQYRIPVMPIAIIALGLLSLVQESTKELNCLVDESNCEFVSRVAKVRKSEDDFLSNSNGDIVKRRQLIAKETELLERDAWNAVSNRMSLVDLPDNAKGRTLVVVTCPGGGIHAAAWASCVLDQLSNEYIEFKDSVCIISGVSGGSVGTLMFVGSRFENELLEPDGNTYGATNPKTEEVHREVMKKSPALELSARSSLEAIAYGIAVDDLYGLIGVPGKGRGQRLEDNLARRLHVNVRDLTLGKWGDRAMDGVVPIVIFNSTDAVTGRRILFDTIPTPTRMSSVGRTARPLNYRELMQSDDKESFDLRPVTAARTSATFPYISPFTRPGQASPLGTRVALCDGGYVDNEGIVTAVNWIEFLLKHWAKESSGRRTFDRILLLRIEPDASDDENQIPGSGGIWELFRGLTGPAEAMTKVRSASQLERGDLETDLVSLYLKVTNSELEKVPQKGQPSNPDAPSEVDGRKRLRRRYRENEDKSPGELATNPKSPVSPATGQPTYGATFADDTGDTTTGPPVVVLTVRFEGGNQVIPLNWKLSNEQKLAYFNAWSCCSSDATPLRKSLDLLFTRKGNEALSPKAR